MSLIDWRTPCEMDDAAISDQAVNNLNTVREECSTSYQVYDSEINTINTADWKRFGAPSVRSDLPPPRVRRVDDTKNYGNEGNAGLLISPSICESFGVYQSDIYRKRPKAQVKSLYAKMGIEIDDNQLDILWDQLAGESDK